MDKKGMTGRAHQNRALVADVRSRMLRGLITPDEAHAELRPMVEQMNQRAKEIAREYGGKYRPITTAALLR